MTAVLRRADEADAAAIARVHVRGWQAGYAGQLPAGYLAALSVETRTKNWAANLRHAPPRTDILLAEVGTEPAGFICVGASNEEGVTEDIGELYAIYLDPEHWRIGIGTLLHDAGLDCLRHNGFRSAVLWVLHGNTRAKRFYAALGWRPDGTAKTEHEDGIAFHELRYARSLC